MNIMEKLRSIAGERAAEGTPARRNPLANVKAEAEIVVRGPDGKIKSTHKANKTVINL